ncbi:MAG: HNH endonuclease [Clostridia bacterium]|nr:HNH endonuclease [Clostridia bacterium]
MAEICNKSVSSFVMRMRNFQYLDPLANENGKKGLAHVAKTDKLIFEQFRNDWGNLSTEAENITKLNIFDGTPEKGAKKLSSLTDRNKVNRERTVFRKYVEAAYNSKCCISGMEISTLLRASHIKPFNKCKNTNERTDPRNGLLLNVLYDDAFDKGLITITKDYRIWVSNIVKSYPENKFTKELIINLESSKIILPRDCYPLPEYLEYHNDLIFKGDSL